MYLRHAEPSDAEAIAAIHTASWRNTYGSVLNARYLAEAVPAERRRLWDERLNAPKAKQRVVLAEVPGVGVVGFACVFSDQHPTRGAYLDNLHISHDWQGQGMGRALLAEVAQGCELQSPGCGLYLSVNQDNQRAQQFYAALGARNAESGIWNAPDGSHVPIFWFTWDSAAALAQAAQSSTRSPSAFGSSARSSHNNHHLPVRRLGAADLDALLALTTHLHEQDWPLPARPTVEAVWAEALSNPRIQYFGGFDGEQLVSSCTITLVPNLTRACRPYGLIENVVTHPAHRGKGWGKRLLQEALAYAWAAHSYKVMLLTGRKDESTLRFYEGAGFSRDGKTGFIARPPG